MRLLRSDTENGLRLDVFDDVATAPPYAILSHRWGNDEVLYGDLIASGPKDGDRFQKLLGCCARARKDGYGYVWIDTCCIDQKSSAELSESINSMYLWYAKSAVCYAYLQDVQGPADAGPAFRTSVWFTRGWTLQELIAPASVVFFTGTWEVIGDKGALADVIQEITKVDYAVLCGLVDIADISVAEKMSWASNRQTTKVEDRAYSLLGIFGVNMTTIYGEGPKAFLRLQHEIIGQTTDHSIFAWESRGSERASRGLLAASPNEFAASAGIIVTPQVQFANQWGFKGAVEDVEKTNTGLRLELPIFDPPSALRDTRRQACVLVLACKKLDVHASPPRYCTVGLVLRLDSEGYYSRVTDTDLLNADRLAALGAESSIEQIIVRDGDGRRRGDTLSREIMAHMPRTYQVVLKARTLAALRDGANLAFIEKYAYVTASKTPSREVFTKAWVEDAHTGEKDFVITAKCRPQTDDDPDGDWNHTLHFCWDRSKGLINLTIAIDPRNPCACRGCTLKFEFAGDFSQLGEPVAKANHYWTLDISTAPTVDIILTRTSVTADMVRYELDFMLRGSQPSTSTKLKPQLKKISKWGLKQIRKIPVEWVPTSLGNIPQGAYKVRNDRLNLCHIIRARHEGSLKPGRLRVYVSWALVPSFNDLGVHRVYEYEVLVGSSSLLTWVPVSGPFALAALQGATPVDGGNADGEPLYIVQVALSSTGVEVDDNANDEGGDDQNTAADAAAREGDNGGAGEEDEEDADSLSSTENEEEYGYGMVRVGDLPRSVWDDEVLLSNEYKVLVYK